MPLKEEFSRQGHMLFRWRSYLPLLFAPLFLLALLNAERLDQHVGPRMHNLFDWICVAIALSGLGWRVFIAGTVPRTTSGRNTKRQKASSLNTTGAYSLVRHPLYLGNFLIFLGVVMSSGVWWLPLIGAFVYMLYYERIMFTEEEFLLATFGESYRQWALKTPAFLPRWSNWQPPHLPFSWRTAVKREYLTLLQVACLFAVVDYAEELVGAGPVKWEPDTTIPFLAVLFFCILIRWFRKQTRVLHVPGR